MVLLLSRKELVDFILRESIQEDDPFSLNNLRQQPTLEAAKKYIIDRLGWSLGTGSARKVWSVKVDGYPLALKLARDETPKTLFQNKEEIAASKRTQNSPYFTHVHAYDDKHAWWIVADLATPISDEEFVSHTGGIRPRDLFDIATGTYRATDKQQAKTVYKKLIAKFPEYASNAWLKGFTGDASKYGINLRDLGLDNMGLIDGRVVMLDYGFANEWMKLEEDE